MAKTLQFRRGTTAELSSQAGAVGELFVDTDKDTVVVMDGSTSGGFALSRESATITTGSYANSAFSKANTAQIHAQAAYDAANTGGGASTGDFTFSANNINLTGDVDAVVNISSNTYTFGSDGQFTTDSALIGDVLVVNDILTPVAVDVYGNTITGTLTVNGNLEVLGHINKNDAVIRVFGTGTPEENAIELQAAVDTVTLLNANLDVDFTFNNDIFYGVNFEYGLYNAGLTALGSSLPVKLSSRIPVAIVVSPGFYDFTNLTTDYLDISGNFIGIVSETGQADIMITSGNAHAVQVSGRHGYYAGLNVVGANSPGIKESTTNSSSSSTFYNCHGGVNSFNVGSGNYIKCSGDNYSFGSTESTTTPSGAGGNFIDCQGRYYCFGTSAITSGTGSNASGKFIRCEALTGFASGEKDIASGTFVDCATSDGTGFGAYVSSGEFYRCSGGQSSFGGGIGGTASGKYYSCIASRYSWGKASDNSGTLTGKLYYCVMRPTGSPDSSTFQTISGSGRTYYCVDAAGNVNNQ